MKPFQGTRYTQIDVEIIVCNSLSPKSLGYLSEHDLIKDMRVQETRSGQTNLADVLTVLRLRGYPLENAKVAVYFEQCEDYVECSRDVERVNVPGKEVRIKLACGKC
eukprot:TRINITY_DN2274_c0_g1_i5.p1 TRINITY_DN2274_c0_g1~~TRINITY_DN2274_c0_g1_i5.p1  ORF type:complete len:107 (+),score=7.99 TRINITY_DN2274_c0_g1_i5:153-473(+)